MCALSNLNSIESRIFERFLKFNRFQRHSPTLKNVEIQDQNKHSGTVERRFNEPLYNEVLGMTNHILQPSNYKMYGKKPRHNEVLDITNQFPQSHGTSLNRGFTVYSFRS